VAENRPDRSGGTGVPSGSGPIGAREYISGIALTLAAAGAGHTSEAMDWLEQALERRCPLLLWTSWPLFDGLRGEPRLQAVMRTIRESKHGRGRPPGV